MGTKLFGVDIAKIVAQNIKRSDMVVMTLSKWVNNARTGGALTAGTNQSKTDYACYGLAEEYDLSYIGDATEVEKGDKKITIIGEPLNIAGVQPEVTDTITMSGVVFDILHVKSDPAQATFQMQCRGRS